MHIITHVKMKIAGFAVNGRIHPLDSVVEVTHEQGANLVRGKVAEIYVPDSIEEVEDEFDDADDAPPAPKQPAPAQAAPAKPAPKSATGPFGIRAK